MRDHLRWIMNYVLLQGGVSLLRIILERIRAKTGRNRRRRETRDHDHASSNPHAKSERSSATVFHVFRRFREGMHLTQSHTTGSGWSCMLEMGFSRHVISLLANLYHKQKSMVRVAGTHFRGFRVRRGVRHGCLLSPYLFHILVEW